MPRAPAYFIKTSHAWYAAQITPWRLVARSYAAPAIYGSTAVAGRRISCATANTIYDCQTAQAQANSEANKNDGRRVGRHPGECGYVRRRQRFAVDPVGGHPLPPDQKAIEGLAVAVAGAVAVAKLPNHFHVLLSKPLISIDPAQIWHFLRIDNTGNIPRPSLPTYFALPVLIRGEFPRK